MRIRNKKNGFTMIELMIVVVIVGVLAAIAIPIYGKYITNSRMTEASSRLGEIVTAAKAYAQENDAWPTDASGGIVDVSPTQYFTYSITAGGGPPTGAFQVTATGKPGDKMDGASLVMDLTDINSNGVLTTTLP